MNSNKYVISIDQGSTSTRAVIYDKNLNIVSSSQIKLEEIYPQDGWVELNPEQITKSVIKSTKNALNNSNINTNDVLSIGITNQRETVVFWDKNTLKPIGNAISWGVIFVDKINDEEIVYSELLACTDCNISLSELEPRSFSFNTPFGACTKCTGLGFSLEV